VRRTRERPARAPDRAPLCSSRRTRTGGGTSPQRRPLRNCTYSPTKTRARPQRPHSPCATRTKPAQARVYAYDLVDLREQSLARIGATSNAALDAELLVTLAAGEEETAVALGRLSRHTRPMQQPQGSVAASCGVRRYLGLGGAHACAAAARHAYLEGEYAFAARGGVASRRSLRAGGPIRGAALRRASSGSRVSRESAPSRKARPRSKYCADRGCERRRCLTLRVSLDRLGRTRETRREAALEDARRSLALALRIGDRYVRSARAPQRRRHRRQAAPL